MSPLAPGSSSQHHGESESVIQLLEHFKDDDGRVALLIKELQELSNRVQVAELATVDPRLTAADPRGSTGDSAVGPSGRRAQSPTGDRRRGADAFASAVERIRHQMHRGRRGSGSGGGAGGPGGVGDSSGGGGDSAGGATASNGGSAGGASNGGGGGAGGRGQPSVSGRVEEAVLPEPPGDTSQPLPLPPGGHEWEALQAAVNDSVAAFGAAAAKMGWKKWALTRAHSALLVSLFWWVVAAAFRSDHPLSRPLQDFAFGHFCRHYVTVVLRLRGKARDQYQQVWIEMMAAAALYLLSEVFPRSQHKFDDGLRALITKQLRLWTAGALPADMHPSAHADAHDAAPAAFSVASAAAAAAEAAANASAAGGGSSAAGGAGSNGHRRSSGLPPAANDAQASIVSLVSGRIVQPAAGSGGPPPRRSSGLENVPGAFRRSMSGRASIAPSAFGGASVAPTASSAAAAAAAASGGAGSAGGAAAGTAPLGGPQAFVFTKNSPLMAAMLAQSAAGTATGTEAGTVGMGGGMGGAGGGVGGGSGGLAGASAPPPIIKGLMKNTVGTTQARMHRALDEGSDEELSYTRLAAAATTSAASAVAAYEASRRAAAADQAASRRGLVAARGAIEARQRAALAGGSGQVKQISDRLSGYIQNDVDRIMAGQPTSTEPASSGADVPGYLRPTAAQRGSGNGPGAESPSIKPARLMAPLYEMRRVEGNIRTALAGGRHSSTDTVARVTALTAAREAAAAADWRPLAQYPVGTKDTRRRKMAAQILHGLDLELYGGS